MTKKIKRAILDFSSVDDLLTFPGEVTAELCLFGDRPLIFHVVDEALSVGVEEICFLKEDDRLAGLFKNLKKREKELKNRGSSDSGRVETFRRRYEDLSFSHVKNLKELSKKEGNFAYLSVGELVHNGDSSLSQLMEVFRTSERPVVGLKPTEMGELETEKIARGLFKVKRFSEQSSFSLLGRAIFTDESRKFFEKESFREILEFMIERGHTIYGAKTEGKWFRLDSYESFLKARSFYDMRSEWGQNLKVFLEEENLID